MKTRLDDLAVFTGRLLIAALFLGGAVQKALSPGGTTGLLADWQLPLWLIWPAFGFNALAGLAGCRCGRWRSCWRSIAA